MTSNAGKKSVKSKATKPSLRDLKPAKTEEVKGGAFTVNTYRTDPYKNAKFRT